MHTCTIFLNNYRIFKPTFQRPLEPDITHVTEDGHAIGEDLAAHLLPTPAKGIVLGQVPTRVRVNHTVKHRMILIQVTILMVVDTVEFRVLLLELLEYVTLDQKKACGTIQNLGEPILDLGLLVPKIHNQGRGDAGQVPALLTRLDVVFSLVPHHRLFGVGRTGDIVTRLDEANDGLGVKVNIGVNKQKVSRLGLLHKTGDGEVTGPMDQRLILGRIKHHLDAVLGTRTLETKHRLGIGLETDAAITRGGDKKGDLTHYSKRNKSP